MIFDTHAHLDARRFDTDRAELIASLPHAGIGLLMNPGCDLPSSQDAIKLATDYPWIYAAVGSHPDAADKVDDQLLSLYYDMAKGCPKVKAIGEIGLDYHYEDVPRAGQIAAFRSQMDLAKQLDLPVIVHMREATEDALKVISDFPQVTGVFHCFSGSAELARDLVRRGWYIGFTGVITFKNARKLVETAEAIPLERMVVETDCPYMAPEPFRGRRNDPSYLYRMVEKLAEIRGISREQMEEITWNNGKNLYRI